MKKIVAIALGTLLLSGCSVRYADMTVGSTKNYNINSNNFSIGKRVSAEDMHPVIFFPMGIPNMKTAIDRAIEQDQCAVGLSNLVITNVNHSFIFGQFGVKVEGNLIIDKSLPGCANHS